MLTLKSFATERKQYVVKRGKKAADTAGTTRTDNPVSEENRLIKTTVFLPEPMNENLAFMALATGTSKADIVRVALAKHMEGAGYRPHSKPRLPERPDY
jgi:hypothetical protein